MLTKYLISVPILVIFALTTIWIFGFTGSSCTEDYIALPFHPPNVTGVYNVTADQHIKINEFQGLYIHNAYHKRSPFARWWQEGDYTMRDLSDIMTLTSKMCGS
jgi:hypothetical protein